MGCGLLDKLHYPEQSLTTSPYMYEYLKSANVAKNKKIQGSSKSRVSNATDRFDLPPEHARASGMADGA